MEKPDSFGAKDFFTKEFSFGKAHSGSCGCDICLESDKVFDELSLIADRFTSEKITSTDSKKICDLIDSELLETLCCGNGIEFEQPLESYQRIWNEEIEGKPAATLNKSHGESCDCIICSIKSEIISKLEDLCSSKSLDDSDLLEMVEGSPTHPFKKATVGAEKLKSTPSEKVDDGPDDGVRSYLVCEPRRPLIITTQQDKVISLLDANTLEEIVPDHENLNASIDADKKVDNEIDKYWDYDPAKENTAQDVNNEAKCQDIPVRELDYNKLVDICLCEKGKLSAYCLQHSVAYCQHMQTKLFEEGCSCSRDNECLFCQRLKCNYCSHERAVPPTCPFISDPQTDDLTLRVSSWLDEKLLSAGVSPDLIEEFSKPIDELKTKGFDGRQRKDDGDLPKAFADHMRRNVMGKQVLNCQAVGSGLVMTDSMKEDILDMNQLFDVRPFPRCYRLKGVKNSDGVYTGIDEEYMDIGFEAWKVPTQFPEDMIPLTAPLPDVEARLEKEEGIRKRAKNLRSSGNQKKVKVIGLTDDWRPVIKETLDTTDYTETYNTEDKIAWSQKIYDEIMDKCEGLWKPEEENQVWSKVQPILDRYGEEVVPASSRDRQPNVELEQILAEGSDFVDQIAKRFKGSDTIGYKPEFWKGLEKWRPPKRENEVRHRLIDEVKKFSKELDSFKNDYERILKNTPGIEIDVEKSLNKVLEALPTDLRWKIERMKAELPDNWLTDPKAALVELESSAIQLKPLIPEDKTTTEIPKIEKVQMERTVSECESIPLSDEDDPDNIGGETETFYYDDEEQAEEVKGEPDNEPVKTDDPTKKEMSVVGKDRQPDASVEDLSTFVSLSSSNFVHRPAPYVSKLKEEMVKNSPEGLHPVQKLWYDRPMFPFWTPSVIYDLSEIEKLFFDGVPEYKPDIDKEKLKEIEDRIFNRVQEIKGRSELTIDRDDVDASTAPKERDVAVASEKDVQPEEPKSVKSCKKSAVKTVSDEDCLIKEDDFKAAIEQLLQAQATVKEVNEDSSGGGALSLDQIKKGIAGRIKSVREGAIELDSNKDFDLESIIPYPALKYRFKLDIFQKQAIIALEAGLSVFVAAHTSAGKTVAAEYAIAMALRNGCRVVYTSPIKALSNQKYNDFTKKFKGQMKVGIITGDVQLNKEAECLIMTTEILRSMLYNQSSILSDLEYVIFDEVHYFNDPERGNVWEEVLILLPHQCQLVMLSATVPDVMNFASWVGSLRKREVVVTTTTKRPVPLKHYIHYSTHSQHVHEVLPIREAEGPFLLENFEKAMRLKDILIQKNKKKLQTQNFIDKQTSYWSVFILNHLKKHNRLPAVIFCFSRKSCDEFAYGILKKVDLVDDQKKKQHIKNFFNRQINMLQSEDRDIRQIVTMKKLLMQGIGVHHSGILPILKEIVEVLFSESQIKLLFATETFAMGVNMPAKTVVFQQVRKFDGMQRRCLKPGEYTQMAGRAGRRGIDKSGTVIITEWSDRMDKCIEGNNLDEMLTGSVDPLESQFRLRYSMILTALKPEGENSIHSIIQKSFFDFSLKAKKDKTLELTAKGYDELRKISQEMKMIPTKLRDIYMDYCNITCQFFNCQEYVREKMFAHKNFKAMLNPGRVVTISCNRYVNVFGVILNVDQAAKTFDVVVMKSSQTLVKSIKEKYAEATDEDEINWFRLIGFRRMEFPTSNQLNMMMQQDYLDLVQCNASHILSFVREPQYKINKGHANSIIDMLRSPRRLYNQYVETLYYFLANISHHALNVVYVKEEDIHFNEPTLRGDVLNYHKLCRAFNENVNNFSLAGLTTYPLLDYLDMCYWFHEKQRAIDKRKVVAQKEELKSLFNDFDSKLEFLKRNKYIKVDDDIVDTKGRIASRMTNFEVFVTEILLKNVLEDLDGPETAALLSCLVVPGVNTDTLDSSNQVNPLFKPTVNENTDLDATSSTNPFVGVGAVKSNRQNLRKAVNKVQAENSSMTPKVKELEQFNHLIEEYLNLPPALEEALEIVNSIRFDLIKQEDYLNIDPMEGSDLSKVTFYLVPIVYAWAKGKPMREIMSVLIPNIQEGILVRWIINLNETIKDIDSATHHFLKDPRIKEKFESASNCIKRGIIDTPSLYLNQRSQTT